jgi:hypothetical protein
LASLREIVSIGEPLLGLNARLLVPAGAFILGGWRQAVNALAKHLSILFPILTEASGESGSDTARGQKRMRSSPTRRVTRVASRYSRSERTVG